MGRVSDADLPSFDAVILAGGSARRLGGTDKAELVVSGRRLIDHVLDAAGDAGRVVVVGPKRHTERGVVWTQEEPPGAGPAAAVGAGLDLVEAPSTVVLAVDLPLLDRALVRGLVTAADRDRAAVAVDQDGRLQPLLACYPTEPLRRVISQHPEPAMSMMSLLNSMRYVEVDDGGRSRDCDTFADLDELRMARPDGGEHDRTMA